jgi:hypothetical protein
MKSVKKMSDLLHVAEITGWIKKLCATFLYQQKIIKNGLSQQTVST